MNYENQWRKNIYFSSKLDYLVNQFLFGSSLLVILFMYYFINLSLFYMSAPKVRTWLSEKLLFYF